MKYKLVYVDEDDGWLNTFYQTFKGDFDILRIKADSTTTLDGIVNTIFENEVDGLVTDYLLDETGEVDFNGNNIVDAVRSYKPYFPAIMLTSYEPQAISQTEDVNIINGKDILDGENKERLEILRIKIKSNIDRYYSLIQNTESRIEELVEKRNNNELEPFEEEELTKLFILFDELEPEGKDMPANLIKDEAITKLNEFVSQTREILDELKKTKE
ncbi:hypothetical protein ACFQ1M_00025 [Sungkyunkwania multivorans]|uniref:Response regulatory domain-containing protein n=1 Tax=Sungkyunkwania multivorans TaxID=1173618 RepID=A0ABW3CSB9_9FLAO